MTKFYSLILLNGSSVSQITIAVCIYASLKGFTLLDIHFPVHQCPTFTFV